VSYEDFKQSVEAAKMKSAVVIEALRETLLSKQEEIEKLRSENNEWKNNCELLANGYKRLEKVNQKLEGRIADIDLFAEKAQPKINVIKEHLKIINDSPIYDTETMLVDGVEFDKLVDVFNELQKEFGRLREALGK